MEKVLLACRAIVYFQNKLLLVSNEGERWVLPGGIAEKGENAKECLVREVREETGLVVEPKELIYVSEFEDSKFKSKKIELFFKCSVKCGKLDPKWVDSDGVVKHCRYFDMKAINSIDVQPPFIFEESCEEVYKGVFHR